jgi:tetratricopeptide (TPR) repeat protein
MASEFSDAMQIRKILLALVCLAAAPAARGYPQITATSYTIWGVVLLPSGTPAPRAAVTLYNDAGFSQEVSSDDGGRFEILAVPRGRFYLRAVNPDDREQYSDPVPVDVSRAFSNRLFFNVQLHAGSAVTKAERHAAGVSVSEAAQRVPKSARREFDRGQSLRAQGKLQAAIEAFDGALRFFPKYFQALASRGHTKIALARVSEAELDFKQALELNGSYEPALRGAGMCEFDRQDYEAAAGHLEKALLQDPRNASSTLFLGIALALLHRPDQARPVLTKALQLDARGAARAHIHLAYILLNENRTTEAIEELDAYIEKAPNSPDTAKFRDLRAQLQAQQR